MYTGVGRASSTHPAFEMVKLFTTARFVEPARLKSANRASIRWRSLSTEKVIEWYRTSLAGGRSIFDRPTSFAMADGFSCRDRASCQKQGTVEYAAMESGVRDVLTRLNICR
jgi:hypothetical protein